MRYVRLFALLLVSMLLTPPPALAVSVKLTWTAPPVPTCGPITAYNMFRADGAAASPASAVKIPALSILTPFPNGLTTTDATVVAGKSYTYFVTAYAQACNGNTGAESPLSVGASATVPAQVIIVSPVLNPPQIIFP